MGTQFKLLTQGQSGGAHPTVHRAVACGPVTGTRGGGGA